ncbi:hypothetical protein R1sor_009814 [Riccia sorocarpa]|uniref:Origin recognition complex subunit 5 C-terminal domain-containing protein n=1 Tax=Riccia sorocarpa TaxID=122646 RepID=A0ABD3HWH1_9MARC
MILFGSGDGVKAKRRRRSSVSSMDKEEALTQEKHLKGPSFCSLERLLAISQCIAADSHLVFEKSEDFQSSCAEESERSMKDVTSNVLVELVSLSSVNLVIRSSSSSLEGLPKFRANVDADFIHKVCSTFSNFLSSNSFLDLPPFGLLGFFPKSRFVRAPTILIPVQCAGLQVARSINFP